MSAGPDGRAAGIRGATTVAAVIGDPVRHSRSPALHNAAFAACGLDWVYVALPVAAGGGAAALDATRTLGIGGLSVTMPLKAEVAAAADERSPAVEVLDAANCIVVLGDGRLRAESTDGAGFLAGLADDAGVTADGRSFAVLGAGGAARAVVDAVTRAGARDVAVVNRTAPRAAAAASLAGAAGRVADVEAVADADVVVNATPVGMDGRGEMPCPPHLLGPDQVVVDLIYGDEPTRWITELRAAGIEAHDGLSMLVHQAGIAFTHWTGLDAPVPAMRAAL